MYGYDPHLLKRESERTSGLVHVPTGDPILSPENLGKSGAVHTFVSGPTPRAGGLDPAQRSLYNEMAEALAAAEAMELNGQVGAVEDLKSSAWWRSRSSMSRNNT